MFSGGHGGGAGEAHQRELRHRAADEGPASGARRRLAMAARRVLPGRQGAAPEEPQLQVLLRLQISRPRLHNVLTTFKLSLAGGFGSTVQIAVDSRQHSKAKLAARLFTSPSSPSPPPPHHPHLTTTPGLLLNTKTLAANELLNLTVDRVHAMLLRTTRELQLTLVVAALQLDNQTLETHHPVVLAPSSNGSLYAGTQVGLRGLPHETF